MNFPANYKQATLAGLLEAEEDGTSIRAYAARQGIARETLRDWRRDEERIMNERQGTVVYQHRADHPELARVTEWIRARTMEQSTPPTVAQTQAYVQEHAPQLLREKTYTAKRSMCARLLKRAHVEHQGYAPVEANQYGDHAVCTRSLRTKCGCKKACGPRCKNRAAKSECTDATCTALVCANRSIQLADAAGSIPRLERRHVLGTGDGMFTLEPISKGRFIREYVGKILDKGEMEAAESRSRGKYIMQLTGGLYIDAMTQGNVSRLFNHSCKPNSVAELWYVNGAARVGIFALRAIRQGEEITYHYGSSYALDNCLCESCQNSV